MPAIDIEIMTPAERLRLISELWDRLADNPAELTSSLREALDRRIASLDADIAAGRTV
jgi:putative addiction module component (TIGR02574 family)